jgi:hypothetical protein
MKKFDDEIFLTHFLKTELMHKIYGLYNLRRY